MLGDSGDAASRIVGVAGKLIGGHAAIGIKAAAGLRAGGDAAMLPGPGFGLIQRGVGDAGDERHHGAGARLLRVNADDLACGIAPVEDFEAAGVVDLRNIGKACATRTTWAVKVLHGVAAGISGVVGHRLGLLQNTAEGIKAEAGAATGILHLDHIAYVVVGERLGRSIGQGD